jgi:hypothetical protein
MLKSDYKLKDLLDIESRFKEYLQVVENSNDAKSLKHVFIAEKDIFRDFAFVGQSWEIEIAGGTKRAIIDELETVLANVKDEIDKKS